MNVQTVGSNLFQNDQGLLFLLFLVVLLVFLIFLLVFFLVFFLSHENLLVNPSVIYFIKQNNWKPVLENLATLDPTT